MLRAKYKAMVDCMGFISEMLADNENLRKERAELKGRLKNDY